MNSHYIIHIWISCLFLSGLQAFDNLIILNYLELFFYDISESEQEKESELFERSVNHPAIKLFWFLTAPCLKYFHGFPIIFMVYQMA